MCASINNCSHNQQESDLVACLNSGFGRKHRVTGPKTRWIFTKSETSVERKNGVNAGKGINPQIMMALKIK